MLQPGGDLDFPQEPVGAHGGGELGVQHFDGDRPAVLQVLREEHRRHAAAAQLALDGVAVRERVAQNGKQVGHRTRRSYCGAPLLSIGRAQP